MTNLTPNWIPAGMMQSLGWALLHFLWQGAALAGLAAVLISLCRRASTRYAVEVGTLVLMLVFPVLTFFVLMPSHPAIASNSSPAALTPRGPADNFPGDTLTTQSRSSSRNYSPWVVEAWLLGVAFFSLRFAGGFLLLERECRRQLSSVSDQVFELCRDLERRLGLDRTIRYCQCKWLEAPAVIGWFRPIVLVPVAALTGFSEEQLQAIIAHELAHIRRYDAFVNVFQIGVEVLLFYHPGVWWLNQRIRAEREHCCDDIAVGLCGNAFEYARALALMEEWRTAPAWAMAATRGPLAERILRVIGFKSSIDRTRRIGLAGGILCLTASLISANALLRITYPGVHARAASAIQSVPAASAQSLPGPADSSAPAPKPSVAPPQGRPEATAGNSYIDGLKAAGLGDFTVDQLIAMKIQGVTPEFVRDLHGLGYTPTVNQLVAMRIQGITPEYVRALKDTGIQPTIDQLMAMRIQGVTPEYVRAVRERGLEPDADKLIAMRIQDVTADYVRAIQALGMKATVDQFISMKIQGVTPEYIKGLEAAGLKLSVDDVIRARIQQIDEGFVQRAVKHGFQNLTVDKLIQLKNLGVLESKADI